MLYLIVTAVVFLASFLFAMLGLGGGMVYVPVLTWAGFPVKEVAIPLGLLLNGLNTLLALITYARRKLVDWKGGGAMAAAAFLAAPMGAYAARYVPTRLLLALFAGAVILAAVRMIAFTRRPEPETLLSLRKRSLIGGGVGALAGFMGGLLGLGGGFIIAPILMWMGYPAKTAAATTTFVVAVSSFSGFLGHLAEGHGDWFLTLLVVLAVVAGSQLGARTMSSKARPETVKKLYAVVLLTIAAKLIINLFQ